MAAHHRCRASSMLRSCNSVSLRCVTSNELTTKAVDPLLAGSCINSHMLVERAAALARV